MNSSDGRRDSIGEELSSLQLALEARHTTRNTSRLTRFFSKKEKPSSSVGAAAVHRRSE